MAHAREIIEREENVERSILEKVVPVSLVAILGPGSVMLHNLVYKKPAISGLHKYAISTVIFLCAGIKINDMRMESKLTKLAVYKDYIRLHPDDFIPQERKKFCQLLLPWTPIR